MKTSKASIERFFSSPAFAVVGASADTKKFGNVVLRMMIEKEFTVYPVNPRQALIEGRTCVPSVAELPAEVKSIITVVPPHVTEETVAMCIAKGITSIWMQPGSESAAATAAAEAAGISVISPECILMFLEPVESFHALHRWLAKLLGKYPV